MTRKFKSAFARDAFERAGLLDDDDKCPGCDGPGGDVKILVDGQRPRHWHDRCLNRRRQAPSGGSRSAVRR